MSNLFMTFKRFSWFFWGLLSLDILLLLSNIFSLQINAGPIAIGCTDGMTQAELLGILIWGFILVLRFFQGRFIRQYCWVWFVVLFSMGVLFLRYDDIVKGTKYASVSCFWLLGFCALGSLFEEGVKHGIVGVQLIRNNKIAWHLAFPKTPFYAVEHLKVTATMFISFIVILSLLLKSYRASWDLPLFLMGTWSVSGIVPRVFHLDRRWNKVMAIIQADSDLFSFYGYPYKYYFENKWKKRKLEWKFAKSSMADGFGWDDQNEIAMRAKKRAEKFRVSGRIISVQEMRQIGSEVSRIEWETANGRLEEVHLLKSETTRYLDAYSKIMQNNSSLSLPFPIEKSISYGVQDKLLREKCCSLLEWTIDMQEAQDLEVIIQAEENLNINLFQGWTYLMFATVVGFLEAMKLLLKHGADIDAVNQLHRTAFFYAALHGNIEAVDCLANAGANINAADTFGYTPLMVATERKHESVVLRLLQLGADQKIKNLSGETALDIAMKSHAGKIATLLRTYAG